VALTKQRIVEEAVSLLDSGGLEAVTFRKLADRLGVQSPTLFWHVKNKAALVNALSEAILAPTLATIREPKPDERWQDWLMYFAEQLRAAVLAHPDGARVVSAAQLSEAMAGLSETAVKTLVDYGMPLRDARLTVLAVERFTIGHALEEQAPRPDDPDFDVGAYTQRYPTIVAAITEYFEPGRTVDDLFRDTLRVILR
jgi:TetR/AcrR family tetracycline transcriptional repressor